MSFLIADSESTQKIGFLRSFLPSWHFFGGSYPPILFLPQKQDFAVREQQNRVCDQPTTDSKNSGSKAYTLKRNLVFFLKFKIHYVRHTLRAAFAFGCDRLCGKSCTQSATD